MSCRASLSRSYRLLPPDELIEQISSYAEESKFATLGKEEIRAKSTAEGKKPIFEPTLVFVESSC